MRAREKRVNKWEREKNKLVTERVKWKCFSNLVREREREEGVIGTNWMRERDREKRL